MALETSVILRSILYNLKIAESLEDAIDSVEAMLDQDTIAAIEKRVKEREERQKNSKNGGNDA